jgi:hypothetical protein
LARKRSKRVCQDFCQDFFWQEFGQRIPAYEHILLLKILAKIFGVKSFYIFHVSIFFSPYARTGEYKKTYMDIQILSRQYIETFEGKNLGKI